MSGEEGDSTDGSLSVAGTLAAAAVALALAVYWTRGLSHARGLGWDEAMNADLPSARILLSLRAGDVRGAFDALLGCSQYPFVYPAVLAVVQAVFGIGEAVCRATGTVIWATTLFGLYRLGDEAARDLGSRRLVAWSAMAIGALSPMALAFAGTLFLEIPFACASVFALRAWLRRRSHPSRSSELAAGAWIALALFTKWNYGLLLALGLALDWLVDAIRANRAKESSTFLRRSAALAFVPLLALAWWFLLPLPGGLDVGAEHRRAVLAFLSLNRDLARVSLAVRLRDAATWLFLTPRMLVIVLLAALGTLRSVSIPNVRTLWLVLAAIAVPTLAHPFQLDRFWIPIAIPLAALGGIGITRILPRHAILRPALLAALVVLAVVYPARAAVRAADFFGALRQEPRIRAYQEDVFRSRPDLSASRDLPTPGLRRGEIDRLLDLVAREAGPEERIGWIGVSQEFSPGALHLGLLERGGSTARFLRDAWKPMDVSYFGVDPGWNDEQLASFVARFDVVFATEPPDLKDRADRRWTRSCRERLVGPLAWRWKQIGNVAIERPLGDAQEVSVIACRPKR